MTILTQFSYKLRVNEVNLHFQNVDLVLGHVRLSEASLYSCKVARLSMVYDVNSPEK